MNKKIKDVIFVLIITIMCLVFVLILIKMTFNHNNRIKANDDWHDYSIAADAVIDLIQESDCDYFYDVIMETDEWDEYYYYRYESHIK